MQQQCIQGECKSPIVLSEISSSISMLSPRNFALRKEPEYTSMNTISVMQMKYLSAGSVGLICLKYSPFMVILLLEPRLTTLVNNTRIL